MNDQRKELGAAQLHERNMGLIEECAQVCDREADRQCAYEGSVRDRGLKATHAATAHVLIAVAQRIRELKGVTHTLQGGEYERMTEYRRQKEARPSKEVLDAIAQGRETGYALAAQELKQALKERDQMMEYAARCRDDVDALKREIKDLEAELARR